MVCGFEELGLFFRMVDIGYWSQEEKEESRNKDEVGLGLGGVPERCSC